MEVLRIECVLLCNNYMNIKKPARSKQANKVVDVNV